MADNHGVPVVASAVAMPTKRQILDLLTADEIAHLFQLHRVTVRGLSRTHLLDSLEEKGPDLATLLAGLLWPRLVKSPFSTNTELG